MKYFLTILITAVVFASATYGWQQMKIEELKSGKADNVNEELQQKEKEIEQLKDQISGLEAQLDTVENRASQQQDSQNDEQPIPIESSSYDVFGQAEFETEVTGYLEVVEGPVPFTDSGETQDNAYLVITQFSDPAFKEELEEGIGEGNTVNARSENGIYFGLGCLKDEGIEAIQYETGKEYLDAETESAILNSDEENQVELILSFGYHAGRGCTCCNLAHQVRLKN